MSISKTLNALSEPNRLKILELLKKRDMTVSEIVQELSITMPTLSHHLDILKQRGLVTSRRDGQKIIYSINLSVIEEAMAQITQFFNIK